MGLRKTICGAPTTSQMACGNLSAQTFHPFGYIGKHFVRPFHPIGNAGNPSFQISHPIERAGNPSFQIFHPIGYIGKRRARPSPSFECANNPSVRLFLPFEYIGKHFVRPFHPFRWPRVADDRRLPWVMIQTKMLPPWGLYFLFSCFAHFPAMNGFIRE